MCFYKMSVIFWKLEIERALYRKGVYRAWGFAEIGGEQCGWRTWHGFYRGSEVAGLRPEAPIQVARYTGRVREIWRETLSEKCKLRRLTWQKIVDYLLTNSQQTMNLMLISSPTMFVARHAFWKGGPFFGQHRRHSPWRHITLNN